MTNLGIKIKEEQEFVDRKVKDYLERATEIIGAERKLWTLAIKDYKEVLVEIAKMIQKEEHENKSS